MKVHPVTPARKPFTGDTDKCEADPGGDKYLT
jgi:hypothetical protein